MSRQKMHFIFITMLALAILAASASMVLADLKFPQPTGYVNDFAGMLSQQTVGDVNGKLKAYEEKSGNEIAVVTVKDLQGTTIEDFASRLFEKWKIGKKGKDNGVLLLIAKEERKMRIEVGYGLEPNLTDAQSYKIIQNVISPAFKAGDYNGGVTAGVDAITKTLSGESLPADPTTGNPAGATRHGKSRNLGWLAYAGFFMIIGFFQWLVSVLGRTKSWWLGGVLGALVGVAVMLFSVIIGIILVAILTPLGFLFDYAVSRAYGERRKHDRDPAGIPWWAGGMWGPGGGFGGGDSGGGFGGFGGGDSGGGGSSGDW